MQDQSLAPSPVVVAERTSVGIKFPVEPTIELGPKVELQDSGAAWSAAWQAFGKLEAFSPPPPGSVRYFSTNNVLAEAVHLSFFEHYPLILSPDAIWLTIAQGLANHVAQNAEEVLVLSVSPSSSDAV